ncbi:cupin domain-containing protein [Halosegnis sp.]|uniref:cupin domain-containing protein n=1 Tax=Halosegnis sp. TaxID=2864959 RepID=UPI0035D4ECC2
MEKIRIDDLDSWQGPASVKRPLGQALGLMNAALNYYELAPGESFAFGYHRHEDQEEVFYILEGTVTFETGDPEDPTTVAVKAGELIRFEPGEWQQGRNDGDERVRALALGAPADSGETTILRPCPDCGDQTPQSVERADDADALVTRCVECRAETGRFD